VTPLSGELLIVNNIGTTPLAFDPIGFCTCLRLLKQRRLWALLFALGSAGRSRLARMAMMAIAVHGCLKSSCPPWKKNSVENTANLGRAMYLRALTH